VTCGCEPSGEFSSLLTVKSLTGMTTDVYPRENCIAPAIVFIVWTTNTKKYAQGRQAKQCLLPMAKHLSQALDNAKQPMLIVRRSKCTQDEGRPLCTAFGYALCTTRSAHAVL
jgi:hypothetical protein